MKLWSPAGFARIWIALARFVASYYWFVLFPLHSQLGVLLNKLHLDCSAQQMAVLNEHMI